MKNFLAGPTKKQYRLAINHPDWPRHIRTKWQDSDDFAKAQEKAKQLGCTTIVEQREVEESAMRVFLNEGHTR